MVITYQGEGYFRIQFGERSILIDPLNQRAFKGTTLALNTRTSAYTDLMDGQTLFWIDHEGEYEVSEIIVQGWSMNTSKDLKYEYTAYRVVCDEIVLGVIGNTEKAPTPEVIGALQGVDILFMPQGGKGCAYSSAEAAKIARQIEPSVVIPSYSTQEVKAFVKELGNGVATPEEKLVCKKKDLTPKALEVKLLRV